MKQIRVCIIGGGASGLIASIFAAKEGAAVAVHFHGNEEKALLGKKRKTRKKTFDDRKWSV